MCTISCKLLAKMDGIHFLDSNHENIKTREHFRFYSICKLCQLTFCIPALPVVSDSNESTRNQTKLMDKSDLTNIGGICSPGLR
jgi:hypothetical protein